MRHIENAFLGSTEIDWAPTHVISQEMAPPAAGAVVGASTAAGASGAAGAGGMSLGSMGSLMSGGASLMGAFGGMGGKGGLTTRESRSRHGHKFDAKFLADIFGVIGAMPSLGELVTLIRENQAQSPTLNEYLGIQGAPGMFRAMSTQGRPGPRMPAQMSDGRISDPQALAGQLSQAANTLQGMSVLGPGRQGVPQRATPGDPFLRSQFGQSGVRNTGLDSLGIIPRPTMYDPAAPSRNRVGHLDAWYNPDAEAEDGTGDGRPGTGAETGVPTGSTRRFTTADIIDIWKYLDLDKMGDIERFFNKANEKGFKIDRNNFTLQEIQDVYKKVRTIDKKLSARSKSNFEAMIAELTAIARLDEGFKGGFGPDRFVTPKRGDVSNVPPPPEEEETTADGPEDWKGWWDNFRRQS